MPFPRHLVIVTAGQEGSPYDPLLERGQAQAAGAWIKARVPGRFMHGFVSRVPSAMETAVLLDLPDEVGWQINDQLFAPCGPCPRAFNTPVPNGESLAEACQRFAHELSDLPYLYSRQVILVVRESAAWCMRAVLESSYSFDLLEGMRAEPSDLRGGTVIYYESVRESDLLWNAYGRRQIVHPWEFMQQVAATAGEIVWPDAAWEEVVRKTFTNDELCAEIERISRMADE